MRVVITGAGVVGMEIAEVLIQTGVDVVIIEKDPNRAKYVSSRLDCIVLQDDGTSVETLKKAGIDKTDIFICVTNSDEVNMIGCAIVTSEVETEIIKIARVRNQEYLKAKILDNPFLGVNYIVNSEIETSRQIANIVALGADSNVMLFENSDLQLRNIIISGKSFFKGKSLKVIGKTFKALKFEFLVAAILRENKFIIPSGETIIQEEDNMYLFATRSTLTKIFMEAGRKSDKIDRILIVGGGSIGSQVCQYLIRTGRKITIVDNNYDLCKDLSEKFPDSLILHADISDETLFEEEQLHKHDLIITVTDNQEINVLTCVYAKTIGIKRAVALVTNSKYISIASKLDIDSVISPKESTVDAILKFVRRGEIKSIHSLFHGKAEAMEVDIDQNSKLCGKRLKDLDMPFNSLIMSVIRNGASEIPNGNFTIQENDTIIAIVDKESVTKLEEVMY